MSDLESDTFGGTSIEPRTASLDALRRALREAIGHAGEDTGIEHWHHAAGGRTAPFERDGVFVDRAEVLATIDLIFAAHDIEPFTPAPEEAPE